MYIRSEKRRKIAKEVQMAEILNCNYNHRRFDVTGEGELLLEKAKKAYGVDLERDCGITKIEFTRLLALLLNQKYDELWTAVNNYVDLYNTGMALGLEQEEINNIIERMPKELMYGKQLNTTVLRNALIARNVDLDKFNKSINKNRELDDGTEEKYGYSILNYLNVVNTNLASLSLAGLDGEILESYPNVLLYNRKNVYAICNYIKDNDISVDAPYFFCLYRSKMGVSRHLYPLDAEKKKELENNYKEELNEAVKGMKRVK